MYLNDSAPDVGRLSSPKTKIPEGLLAASRGQGFRPYCQELVSVNSWCWMPPRVASWPRRPRDFVTIEELVAPGSDQLPLEEVLGGRRMQPDAAARGGCCLEEGPQPGLEVTTPQPSLPALSQPRGKAFCFLPFLPLIPGLLFHLLRLVKIKPQINNNKKARMERRLAERADPQSQRSRG